ncbi:hypothetical protein [Aeromonas sobria]|uniref:hypothetical protein n=1 Tax=Aeromonas sobria TaxID=646 RepID=UPI0026EB012A|nr:hypothetical protein [Aeromonas sobria]
MTYNITAMPQEVQQQFELQKKAALWVCWVNSSKPGWTRERVRVELGQVADDVEREALREWLRHYDAIAKSAAKPAAKPTNKKVFRHAAR